MEQLCEEKTLHGLVIAELKGLGIKVPKVKKQKSNSVKQDKNSVTNSHKIFGASLNEQEWITDSEADCPVPKFISAATSYLKTYTKAEIGLFRKAGSVARQRELRAKLDKGGNFVNCEPNDVASLLKQWLRELPEPLIPANLHDLFIRCQDLESENERVNAVILSCLLLPSEHLYTLKHLLKFLNVMSASSDVNKMSIHNLAVIMAPNLMPGRNDSTSKSNNLVQNCTRLIEILISNVEMVGVIPQKIIDQLMTEESDFTDENLDFCSYKKRKFKNGGGGNVVTDLVTGIRKMVGSNCTPMTSSLDVPEIFHSVRSSTRVKNTKENGMETPYFTPISKVSHLTPLNAFGANTPLSHFRKKSLEILNKKYKKRTKSLMKSIDFIKEIAPMQIASPVAFQTDNIVREKIDQETEKCPKESVDSKPKLSDIAENIFMKRAVSDCLLENKKCNSKKSSKNSLSTGHLPNKNSLTRIPQHSVNFKRRSSRKKVEKGNCKSVKHSSENVSFSKGTKVDIKCNISSKQITYDKQLTETNTSVDILCEKPHKTSRSSLRTHSTERNSMENFNYELSLNETSNCCVASRDKISINDVHKSEIRGKNTCVQTVTPSDRKIKVLSASVRRNLNKSSLKRGRPNTIKTGLPSELCPKYNDSASFTKLDISHVTEEPKKCTTERNSEDDCSDVFVSPVSVDSPTSVHLEFHLKDDSEMGLCTDSGISSFDTERARFSLCKAASDLQLADLSACQVQSAIIHSTGKENDIKISHKRASSTDISMSPRSHKMQKVEDKENSPDIVRRMDFTECSYSFADKENMEPEEEIWHSEAESFLNSNLIPSETHCKRESIIQLMVKNAGKVQESVQFYDHIVQDQHRSSSKKLKSQSKSFQNDKMREQSRKSVTGSFSGSPAFYKGNSTQKMPTEERRVTRSQSKKYTKFSKSPIPLPPKFSLTENDGIVPTAPLKEVTNVTIRGRNSSRRSESSRVISTPPYNLKDSPLSEGSRTVHTSLKKRDSVAKKVKQKIRHSEGDDHTKTTRVLRSESSPLLIKEKSRSQTHLKDCFQSSLPRKSLHSSMFIPPSYHLPKQRSVSRVSIRDIDDLKNIHLRDAWECKM